MAWVKLLGLADIAAALVLALTHHSAVHWHFSVFFAAFLIIKGLSHTKNLFNLIDLLVGIYLLITIMFPMGVVTTVFCVYLVIKGFVSLRS